MPIELRRTEDEVRNELYSIGEEYGLTRTDRLFGGFVESIVRNISSSYSNVYDLEVQSRIDTATDEWLESWARIHGQSLEVNEGGEDLSFENVYLTTSNNEPVSRYIAENQELFLPSGVTGSSTDGRVLFTTLDPISFTGNRAFTRVVLPAGINTVVNPGTYTTNISLRDFAVRGLSELPEIVAVVQNPIVSNQRSLSETELRSIIFDRALSRNKANNAGLRTTLQISNVAKVITNSFNSGSSSLNVFIEPTLGILTPALEARIRGYLETILPDGTRLNLGRMVGSLASFKLKARFPEDIPASSIEDLLQQIKLEFISLVNATGSGDFVNFESIALSVANTFSLLSLSVLEVRVNGKRISTSSYQNRDIEFVFTDNIRIEITA